MACEFDIKYEPLILSWVEEKLSEEQLDEKLKLFKPEWAPVIKELYFKDAKLGNGGSVTAPSFTRFIKLEDTKRKMKDDWKQDELSTRANYVGDFRGYSNMIRSFKRNIIERSVYNRNFKDGKVIGSLDPNAVTDGITNLNRWLFEYKLELVNTLMLAVHEDPVKIDINSETAGVELTQAIAVAKTLYEASMTADTGWDEYVILTHFNELLEEQTPFIKLAGDFKNTSSHGVKMYVYEGPKANLRKTFSKEDEIPSAEAQYSGLANILLDYFEEVDASGTPISGTSIGTAGFASIMSTMRSAMLYHPRFKNFIDEYMKGAKADFNKMIDAYILYLEEGNYTGEQSFNKPYYSYLINKLRGIQKYIFASDSNMQEDIQNMFKRMFFSTVPLQYLQYGYFNGEWKGATIAERWVNNQNYRVQRVINGRIGNFRTNKRTFGVVQNRYNIRWDKNSNGQRGGITFTVTNKDLTTTDLNFTYTYDSSKKVLSIKPADEQTRKYEDVDVLTDLIYDTTGYLLTSEYQNYMKSSHGNDHYILQDFASALSLVIMASDLNHTVNPLRVMNAISDNEINFNRNRLYNLVKDISSIDALIKGSETNNTVRDVNNNNLPTRGITSLAYQLWELHRKYIKPEGISLSPARHTIIGQMLPYGIVTEPLIREGVSKQGRGKKARQLTEPELYECAIVYDFFEHLHGDGILHLQNDTFADKGKTFVWGWNLNVNDGWIQYSDHLFPKGHTQEGMFKRIQLLDVLRDMDSFNEKTRNNARNKLNDFYTDLRMERYKSIETAIVNKFNIAFERGKNAFKSLKEINDFFVKNHTKYTDIIREFDAHDQELDDELDVVLVNPKDPNNSEVRINETLLNNLETFVYDTTGKRALSRLERSKRRFLTDLIDSGFRLNRYSSKGGKVAYDHYSSVNSEWVDTKSGKVILGKTYTGTGKNRKEITINSSNIELLMDPNIEVVLNPMLEAYFYADITLSNDLSTFMVGETFTHKMGANKGDPNKKAFDENGETEAEEYAEATRLIAQIKRNVIPGASMHQMLQGVKYGIADEIDVAIFDDIKADVWNMFGITDRIDSSDGSGISSIYEAMMEQNSLLDAATGLDMKTIGWDVDPKTLLPRMLKWAVYATTNQRRRDGHGSRASVEELHRRLHEKVFDKEINLQKYFTVAAGSQNFYFFNNETGQYYKITDIKRTTIADKTYYYKEAIETDANGNYDPENSQKVFLDRDGYEIEVLPDGTLNTTPDRLKVNTIYDIDIFFGGAYGKEKNVDGDLIWSNHNNIITLKIIGDEELKKYMIGYAVNKSAYKVGYGNVNSVDTWYNKNKRFKTIKMSTRHLGLQMNAEHDLLDSEVTEMTQMISALAENWYLGDLVKQIYNDIGAVVDESLRSIDREIQANDMNALRIRLGKALIDAFKTRDDTIGLAQAFLAKAEVALKDSNAKVNIPFSAATINETFISTIVSNLNKKGIRRKYSGIASVLTPSYDLISYYRYTKSDGSTYTTMHSGVSQEVRNWKVSHPGFSKTKINDFIHNFEIEDDLGNKIENPFLENIVSPFELGQEDTIFVYDPISRTWSGPIILNSYQNYNYYTNTPLPQGTIIKRLRIAPRNLKGADTKLTINDINSKFDGIRISVYNFGSVMASHGDQEQLMLTLNDSYWENELVYDANNKLIASQSLKNIVQRQLKELHEGKLHDSRFGDVHVSDVNVEAAEIIMGRMFADKFGLKEGDQVDDILHTGWEFFYNRWQSKYGKLLDKELPSELYDVVIYTKNGPLLVKLDKLDSTEVTRNNSIETIDDNYIFGNSILCSAEGKTKYSYLTNSNREYNIIVTDADGLQELLDSDMTESYRYNVTTENVTKIGKIVDPDGRKIKAFLNLNETKDESLVFDANTRATVALRNILNEQYKEHEINLAKQRFAAFEMSLNLVGARIPTQAMQSFMPLRIIAFTDDTTNIVYVPRMQTWLQGSDYDIDKLYILAYSIADNGTLPTLSGLSKVFPPQETLRLPIPNGIKYSETDEDGDDTYFITLDKLEQVTNLLKNAKTLSYEEEYFLFDQLQFVKEYKYRLDPFLEILRSGKTKIKFQTPKNKSLIDQVPGKWNSRRKEEIVETLRTARNDIYENAKKQFIYLLNKHSMSKSRLNREMALRNNVTFGIFNTTTAPVNQINAHAPIEMDEVDDIANSTALSRMEKRVSSDIPSTKFKIQVQASVGKDVTGISAVSVKCFFAETTYFNDTLSDVITNMLNPDKAQIGLDILDSLVMENPIYQDTINGRKVNSPVLIGNANVTDLISKILKHFKVQSISEYCEDVYKQPIYELDEETLKIVHEAYKKYVSDKTILKNIRVSDDSLLSRWNSIEGFKIWDCLVYLNNRASLVDVALSESGLLSSATDNMKHLYLPKLNATAQFVDMYTTMLTHGVKMEDMANILTAPLFTAATKLTQYNIFRNETTGYSVDRALGFYLNTDTLPHVNKQILAEVLTKLKYKATKDDIFKYLHYDYEGNRGTNIDSRDNLIKQMLSELYAIRNITYANLNARPDIDAESFMDDFFEGYYEGFVDEEGTSNKYTLANASLETLNTAINYLEECIIRNENIRAADEKAKLPLYSKYKDAKVQLANIQLVKDYIIPKTEEQRMFGQMLGINGGIRTSPYAIYSLVRRIENHVNKRVEEALLNGKGWMVGDELVKADFDLFKFLDPSDKTGYRNQWIENYGHVKSSFNILDAITRVPHFKRMFDVLFTNNFLLSAFSAKYEVVNSLAREIERRHPYRQGHMFDRILNEKEYKQIESYVNDVFIMGWLQKQNLQFKLPIGNIVYEQGRPTTVHSIVLKSLDSFDNFATFKNWMDTYVIPALQSTSNTRISENLFIRSLEFVSDKDKLTQKTNKFHRLPLNMMTIDDSVKTKDIYDGYLRAFDEIKDVKIDTNSDWTIANLFFIYNLITNKDSYGQNSLTRIFENIVSGKKDSSLINSFYEYISDIDEDSDKRKTFIEGLKDPVVIRDIESRISLYVPTSNIEGNVEQLKALNYDYTFSTPSLGQNWNHVKEKVFPYSVPESSKFTISIDSMTIRDGILERMQELFGDKIRIVRNENLENLPEFADDESIKNATAFIHNGVLYLRSNLKTESVSAVHELVHLLMAGLRFSENPEYRKFYYDTVNSIDIEALRKVIGSDIINKYEKYRIGVDLKEEIFAKVLEKYLTDSVLPSIESLQVIHTNSDKLSEIFNYIFGTTLVTSEFFKASISSPEAVFETFSNALFSKDGWIDNIHDSIIWVQKIADLKKRLRDKNLLYENCD